MSELGDDIELQTHSRAVLYILAAVAPPRAQETTQTIMTAFVDAIKSATVCHVRYPPLLHLKLMTFDSNGGSD